MIHTLGQEMILDIPGASIKISCHFPWPRRLYYWFTNIFKIQTSKIKMKKNFEDRNNYTIFTMSFHQEVLSLSLYHYLN